MSNTAWLFIKNNAKYNFITSILLSKTWNGLSKNAGEKSVGEATRIKRFFVIDLNSNREIKHVFEGIDSPEAASLLITSSRPTNAYYFLIPTFTGE